MYKTLSIAGFDGSGGAGIQADLKTFSALGVYGMTVLTAIPVQNTQGVKSCYEIELKCIEEQLETIFEDIVPDAIKIGMLFKSEIIDVVYNFLKKNAVGIPIVLDPVMVAKSGDRLLLKEAIDKLKNKMIEISTVVTPNIPEAYELTKIKIECESDIKKTAKEILNLGADNVLIKGGHLEGELSNDYFFSKSGDYDKLTYKRIETKNTHGTGCTLSAAICSYMALGLNAKEAVKKAKEYLSNAIEFSKEESVGKGHGPVQHFYNLWKYL